MQHLEQSAVPLPLSKGLPRRSGRRRGFRAKLSGEGCIRSLKGFGCGEGRSEGPPPRKRSRSRSP